MTEIPAMPPAPARAPTGDELLKVLTALGNPHRMRIVESLLGGRDYVSKLARDLGIGRPLLHMHLQRLEAAGIVTGELELSRSGKAMKYFELTPFCFTLTPEVVAAAARTLSEAAKEPGGEGAEKTEKRDIDPRTPLKHVSRAPAESEGRLFSGPI